MDIEANQRALPGISYSKGEVIQGIISQVKDLTLKTLFGCFSTLNADPRGLAIALLAQKTLYELYNRGLKSIDPQPFQTKWKEGGRMVTGLSLSFLAGHKMSKLTGYETSLTAMLSGSILYLIAKAFYFALTFQRDDPFEKSSLEKMTTENFEKEVLNSKIPVLVDAYASWCSPCRALAPILESLSHAYAGKIKFMKWSVTEEDRPKAMPQIEAIPTLYLYHNGKIVAKHQGFLNEKELKTLLGYVLQNEVQ